jgi:hypothetical protein
MNDEQWRNRVDQKLDQINEAIVTLARIDERIVTLFKRMDRYEATQDEHSEDIAELQKIFGIRGAFFSRAERFLWILITVAVGTAGFWGK